MRLKSKKIWFKAVDYVLLLTFFISMFAGITIPAGTSHATEPSPDQQPAVVAAVENVVEGENEVFVEMSSCNFYEGSISGQIMYYPDGQTSSGEPIPVVSDAVYRDGDMGIIIELAQPFAGPTAGDAVYKLSLQTQTLVGTYNMTPDGPVPFKVVPNIAPLDAGGNNLIPGAILSSGAAGQEISIPLPGAASIPNLMIGMGNIEDREGMELDAEHGGVYINTSSPDDDMVWAKLPNNLKPGKYGIAIMKPTLDGHPELFAASKFGVQGVAVVDDLEPGIVIETELIAVGQEFPATITSIAFSSPKIGIKDNLWLKEDSHTVVFDVYAAPDTTGSIDGILYDVIVNGSITYSKALTVKTTAVTEVQNVVAGDWNVPIKGYNLDMVDYTLVTGAVYNNYVQKIADLDKLFYDDWNKCLNARIVNIPPEGIPAGSYTIKLLREGVPFGGQDSYPFKVVPPVGIDKSFEGTSQKIQIVSNGNNFGSDNTLLKAVIMDKGKVVQESVYNSVYNLAFSGTNLVFGVPDNFDLQFFMVEIYKKPDAGSSYALVSRGFYGDGGEFKGPEYGVGPEAAMPGSVNIPFDIFGSGFDSTSTVQIFVYSEGSWVADNKILLGLNGNMAAGSSHVTVVNDPYMPIGVAHIQTMMTVPNDAVKGFRKVKVTTGSSVVEIDNKFRVMVPVIINIAGENIDIDPNGNPLGTVDASKLKLVVFVGPYPLPDITSGFTIDGSGHIILPFSVRPELKYAKGFGMDILRIEGDNFTFVGKGQHMKPGVGPEMVMQGSFNIPLDIWAADLTADSTVAVNVYDKDTGNWVNDPSFILDNTTRKIIEEPGNIGGATKHYQIMMSVKETASIGPRQIVVTNPSLAIKNALNVMPNMAIAPPPGTDIPFMAMGSNVEKMGTVSPDIMFIGVGFTRDIVIDEINRAGVGNAIQIRKLDETGNPTGELVAGTAMNPPAPPGSPEPTMEKNVILFKPTAAALQANSTYRLTIEPGTIQSTDGKSQAGLSNKYEVTFTTSQRDTSAPGILRVEVRPSPTDGAIVFQFNKPVIQNEAENTANYSITTTRPVPQGNTIIAKYDPMMNMVKLVGYDLAVGDTVTGTVSGIHSTAGAVMNTYNVNITVKGFEMGAGDMTNTQKAFTPVEVMPTNPSAQSESHYFVRMPVQQRLAPGDKIEIVFPAGFNVASASLDSGSPINKDINGSGEGTVTIRSVSAESISRTVTVTMNVYTADQASDFIQFELKGIINGPEKQMQFDAATGAPKDGYYCVVTTKSSAGTAKEGPMNSMMFPMAKAASGSIAGYVKNNSEAVIANVKVYLDGPGGRKEALTDNTGKFSFTGLVPGGYFLTTEPSPDGGSYVGITMPRQYFIDITARIGEEITYTQIPAESNIIKLEAGASYNNLTINVTSGASMAGRQIDVFAGNPASFAVQTITLDGSGAGTTALKLQKGIYMVGVGPAMPKGGFTGPVQMDWMPPMPTRLDIQNTNSTVNITIDVPNATIIGTVKDGNDNAIPNAEVFAYSPSGTTMGSKAVTNASGQYTLKVKAGEYAVGTHVSGMPWLPDRKVAIASNETIAVNFKYEALDATISGTVKDSDGRPIAQASVIAYRVDANSLTAKPVPGFANAITDASGNFTLFVKPNSYWILAGYAPNYGELPKKVVAVGASNKSGEIITVETNTMGTVKGTVTMGGQPVVNAGIWAEGLGADAAFGNRTATNAIGEYTLKLKTGNYKLHLWTPEIGEVPLGDEADITITAATAAKNFALPAKGTITVNFGAQQAGFEAFVHTKSADGKYQNGGVVKLNDAGTASVVVNVPVENTGTTYNLKIYVPGVGDSNTITEFSGKTASLTTGTPTATVNVSMPAALRTLSGTVTVSGSGTPVSNAWVSITKKNSAFGAYKKTDASGNFDFKVPDGTYILTADHPNYTSRPPAAVTVSGNTTQNLNLDSVSGSIVTGTVFKDSIVSGNEVGSNLVVWATSDEGRWVRGEVYSDGIYYLNLPDVSTTWLISAAGDGYETIAVNKQKITVTEPQNITGKNILMTKIKIAGIEYTVKPPEVKAVTPATGGVIDNKNTGVKVTVPANALGSSTDSGQITTKETTGVPSTNLAKPAGSIGKEIKASDSSGNAITKLNDYIDIELDYSSQLDSADNTKLIDGTEVANLQLGYWDDTANNWVFIASTNDTANHVLKGKVDHLTTFAPLVPTGEAAPASPTGLSASTVSTSGIDLTWISVTGAASYNIYRSAASDGTYTKINTSTVSTTSYSDTGLIAGTAYYYKVSAVNGTGESGASSYATAGTAVAASSTPTGLAVSSKTSTSITMTWNAVSGAAGYKLYKSSAIDGNYNEVYSGSNTSYAETGLTAATTYYYKASAINAGGESALSSAVGITTNSESVGGAPTGGSVQPEQTQTTAEDVTKLIGDINPATDPAKASQDLVGLINDNKDLITDTALRTAIVETAAKIIQNASTVDSTKIEVVEEAASATIQPKAEELAATIENIAKVVGDLETAMKASNMAAEAGQLKKEIIISTTGVSADKEIKVALPDSVVSKAVEKSVSVILEGKDVRFVIPAGTLQVNELSKASELAKTEGKVAYAEISFKKLDEVTLQAAEIKLIGKAYEFEAAAIVKDGNVEQTRDQIAGFGSKISVEMKYSDTDVQGISNLDKLGVYTLNEQTGKWDYVRSKIDKSNKKLVFNTTHFSKYAIMEYTKTFDDVPAGHWAKDYIELLAAKHITTGMDENNFAPRGTVTRAQFAAFIVRALDIEKGNYAGTFSDVAEGAWHAEWIEAAAKAGLVQGLGHGKFYPDAAISRQEMAVMIMRAYQYQTKKDIADEAQKSNANFTDAGEVSGWAKDAVLAAQANGIINGMTETTFAPKESAQRDQAAKMLIQLLKVSNEI